MKTYMVFDGRAKDDVDRAFCLESIGKVSLNRAIKQYKNSWGHTDAVLVSYDDDGEELVNEEIVWEALGD